MCMKYVKSDWLDTVSGFGQGSHLGPLLLLLFIIDLFCLNASKIIFNADDTKNDYEIGLY